VSATAIPAGNEAMNRAGGAQGEHEEVSHGCGKGRRRSVPQQKGREHEHQDDSAAEHGEGQRDAGRFARLRDSAVDLGQARSGHRRQRVHYQDLQRRENA
jgi:hypothetical protein